MTRRRLAPRRPQSLRAWFAVGFGALLALAVLNIGAFYWGARQRAGVFRALHAAIERHSALIEARTGLEDHAKRVKVVSDLLGVERASLSAAERAATLASIDSVRRLARKVGDNAGADDVLRRVATEVDSLGASWASYYRRQGSDPEGAIEELVLVAEPLAARLLGADLPSAIRAEHVRVELASAAFEHTDRTSSALVWVILAVSGLCSVGLALSVSRDVLRAIVALKAGTERFGAGELSYRVAIAGCEELGEVGESMNAMSERLAEARGELERSNQELAHLAFRDPLTKLANRALFRDRVGHTLARRGHLPAELFVLFVDLDDFKSVNDTLGHAAGDALLVDVAERLLNATRGSDTVARLGGDEFAILLDQVHGTDEAIVVAERVLRAMDAPFAIGARTMHIGLSVGIACGEDGESADELLRNADVAMYRAKATGKRRYAVFAPEMHAALLDRVELAEELLEAVQHERLTLAYQPIVDLDTRRVTSFEVLARWHHPRRGAVPPNIFVPLAEETGAILALGRWVLRSACREAAGWQAAAPDGLPVGVSVNVSARQLDDPGFVREVRDALEAAGLPASCLTLEITETVIMREGTDALRWMQEVKALGVRIAIDDFGTGYSSLAYLQRLPVDVLKIDKAFVDQIADGGNDTAIAHTIVSLGETLALRTVAEGIEDGSQHEELRRLGCDLGQGYHYARPLSAADAAAFLAASRAEELASVV